ncbi:MAG: SDR family oxidoreductase [Ruminococcus flavefaciens]|nr:SDR family oxidoreductase [Ruminococcus flavefaciens]
MILQGKVAVVTGVSRGIGKAIAEEMALQGAVVYGVSRSGKTEEQSLETDSGEVIHVAQDITDIEQAKKLFMQIQKEREQIDILVNNAGVMKDALLGMISDQMMRELFEVNVFALIQWSQLAARFMKRKKKGSIIQLASIIGTNGNAGQSVYSATKGAVISFTKSAAKELASDGIRVNAVAPGIIQTDLLQNVPEKLLEKRIEGIRMGHIGSPQDVAAAVTFLASDQAKYISGQILGVDGCTIL